MQSTHLLDDDHYKANFLWFKFEALTQFKEKVLAMPNITMIIIFCCEVENYISQKHINL